MAEKLVVGLPSGNLNSRRVFNIYLFLKLAGFNMSGYEPGSEKETIKSGMSGVEFVLSRSQNLARDLAKSGLDAAIFGSDTYADTRPYYAAMAKLAAVPKAPKLVLNFGFGRTRLMWGVHESSPVGSLDELLSSAVAAGHNLKVASEYVNVAREALESAAAAMVSRGEGKGTILEDLAVRGPLTITKYGFLGEGSPSFMLQESDGKTEQYVWRGLTDLILDVYVSGGTFRQQHLKPIGAAVLSEAGLYASALAETEWSPEKSELFNKFVQRLQAVRQEMEGLSYVVAKSNVPWNVYWDSVEIRKAIWETFKERPPRPPRWHWYTHKDGVKSGLRIEELPVYEHKFQTVAEHSMKTRLTFVRIDFGWPSRADMGDEYHFIVPAAKVQNLANLMTEVAKSESAPPSIHAYPLLNVYEACQLHDDGFWTPEYKHIVERVAEGLDEADYIPTDVYPLASGIVGLFPVCTDVTKVLAGKERVIKAS